MTISHFEASSLSAELRQTAELRGPQLALIQQVANAQSICGTREELVTLRTLIANTRTLCFTKRQAIARIDASLDRRTIA